jgi:hypothetical protein
MSNKDAAVTPAGKEIIARNIPGTGLLEVVFASGGERPPEFQGSFTDIREADLVIQRYLERRAAKEAEKEAKQQETTKKQSKVA